MKATYIDHMGTDLSVVNAARVSFGKISQWDNVDRLIEYPDITPTLSKSDQGLIAFLARGCTSGDWDNIIEDVIGTSMCDLVDPDLDPRDELLPLLKHIRKMPDHWTPFGHTAITLHIKAPIFVARQLGKHQVGTVWNEVSRRYVSDEPEFFYPPTFRKTAENVKQGSSDEEATLLREPLPRLSHSGGRIKQSIGVANAHIKELYEELLASGVCPEQARMVLPQSMYTEWYWTGNLYSFANVFVQRSDSHAQREVQEIARQIGEIIQPLYPVSWDALTK